MNTKQWSDFRFLIICLYLLIFSPSIAAIIYVDADNADGHDGQSWSTAFHKLQDALAIAGTGDEIRVAQGVYRPDETSTYPTGTGDRQATFTLADSITLIGGYAGLGATDPNVRDLLNYKTILSGDLENNDSPVSNASQLMNDPARSENSHHVISIPNSGTGCLLDGFTLSGGIANGIDPDNNGGGIRISSAAPLISNCRFEYNAAVNGGAVYTAATSNPTFSNCTFLRNYAQGTGGAIRNITSCSPALSNCMFIENKAAGFGGAIGNYNNCNPTILQCTFTSNWANAGGAINNYDFCSPRIAQSIFRLNATNNTGGAIRNENHSDPCLVNCGFYGNAATHGGGLYSFQSNPVLMNCVASGNLAVEYGGVLYNRDAISASIVNCTFTGNSAVIRGAAVYNIESSPTIRNCILWNNAASDATPIYTDSGSPSVSYSCIQGGWSQGVGNIDADPLFIDPNGPDGVIGTGDDQFILSATSPCIDLGDNTAVPADLTDLDNNGNILERVPLDFNGQARFLDVPDVPDTGIPDLPAYPAIIDMGAYERCKPILVDWQSPGPAQDGTSWQAAYHHLQDALAASKKGDVIWVAQGIYQPDRSLTSPDGSGNRTAVFDLTDGIILQGGYAGSTQPDSDTWDFEAYPTILSGDLLGNDTPVADPTQMQSDPSRTDNAYHVITANGTGIYTEMDGFTIRDGHAGGPAGTSTSLGAGMFNTDAIVTITHCSFQLNYATTGGALYNYGCTLVFSDCSFSQNAAADKGGVMRNTINTTSAFWDCLFTGNTAGGFGGTISNNDHSPSTMTRCIFLDNVASSAAAINNFIECDSVFTDCQFDSNQAAVYGGAVNNYQQSDSQFIRCDFSANAASAGGAIYNDSSNPTVMDCIFADNTTISSGGAIFSTGSPITIENSTFLTNQSGNFGGALYNIAISNLNLINCTLTSNSAVRGGAIFCTNSAPTVMDCTFLGNTTTESGGAFYNLSENLSIEKCIFRNNQSGVNGGGLCTVSAANASLENCVFSANTAVYDGGGLYLENITAANLANCLITYNTAQYGGGIANSGLNGSNLIHCTLSKNTAQIGAGIYNASAVTALKNSIVYDQVSPSNSVIVSYSCALNGLETGNGNINLNPSFVDPDGPDGVPGTIDDNFRLIQNSPCLDAADNSAIPTDLDTDLDGLPRIIDADCNGVGTADMGAYEFSYLLMGDFNSNCVVDLPDFADMAGTWLMGHDDPDYDSKYDISVPRDNIIDWKDLIILCENWLVGI